MVIVSKYPGFMANNFSWVSVLRIMRDNSHELSDT